MYNQGADFYDKTNDNDKAELYRMKIAMLFCKPKVLEVYQATKPVV
jgi:hypothetical protein